MRDPALTQKIQMGHWRLEAEWSQPLAFRVFHFPLQWLCDAEPVRQIRGLFPQRNDMPSLSRADRVYGRTLFSQRGTWSWMWSQSARL